MPKRTYVGPHDEVELAATGQVVRRGDSVTVDADLAELLDAQLDNWAKTNTKAAREADSPDASPPPPEMTTVDGQPIDTQEGDG